MLPEIILIKGRAELSETPTIPCQKTFIEPLFVTTQ